GKKIDRLVDRVDAVVADVLGRQDGRDGRRSRTSLLGFRSRRDDGFVEERLQARRVIGARVDMKRHRGSDRGDESGQRPRAHSNTFISLRASALSATFWRLACVRLTRSLGRPETTSKPRTMPPGT